MFLPHDALIRCFLDRVSQKSRRSTRAFAHGARSQTQPVVLPLCSTILSSSSLMFSCPCLCLPLSSSISPLHVPLSRLLYLRTIPSALFSRCPSLGVAPALTSLTRVHLVEVVPVFRMQRGPRAIEAVIRLYAARLADRRRAASPPALPPTSPFPRLDSSLSPSSACLQNQQLLASPRCRVARFVAYVISSRSSSCLCHSTDVPALVLLRIIPRARADSCIDRIDYPLLPSRSVTETDRLRTARSARAQSPPGSSPPADPSPFPCWSVRIAKTIFATAGAKGSAPRRRRSQQ